MKIIADTKQGLIDAIKHYACLRLEFRSSVFSSSPSSGQHQECHPDFMPCKALDKVA